MSAISAKGLHMRAKQAFSLYCRKLSSGKTVWYYQTYDEDGLRTNGKSTGKSTKTAAREYCNALMTAGQLLPSAQAAVPAFKEFAVGWWDYEKCAYLKRLKARRAVSRGYGYIASDRLKNHILPAFGSYRLDKITDVMIDDWLLALKDRGLSANTANNAFRIFSVMLGEACRRGLIKHNPCKKVSMLKVTPRNIELYNHAEVKALFSNDWSLIWRNEIYYLLNKLAACTGLRVGEVLGLRSADVHEGYIHVKMQYGRWGYDETKNHKDRIVPLPYSVYLELKPLMDRNGDGYIFSKDGGESPVNRRLVNDNLYRALDKIGIDAPERKRRNITFHTWRHFFNTTLLLADVNAVKVRACTGHLSEYMTEKYTHVNTKELSDIKNVQEKLFIPYTGLEQALSGAR